MPHLTETLPTALRQTARWQRLGDSQIPAMLVHPARASGEPVPVVIWMHGRTVYKEIDPGRYLRWMRSGIAACAVDLPGHGERFDATLQQPQRTWTVVRQMIDEIDEIVDVLTDMGWFDMTRVGIGGMSAGGMATLARLCADHPFQCASVEATSGSWQHQSDREMFHGMSRAEIDRFNPIANLHSWREIPVQALHNRHDQWVKYEGQHAFIEALREQYDDPSVIDFVVYEHSGAPNEHAGFGRYAADAKNRQREFYRGSLVEGA